MTVSPDTIRDWRGEQDTRSVQIRRLAASFRRGENLHHVDLRLLRDWAVENGNHLLAERVREELRTERTA